MYIKNKTSSVLPLIYLGVDLGIGEQRLISEFATRDSLQNCSEYLNSLVYEDKIIIVDADNRELTKAESVQYISNAYSVVKILSSTTDSDSRYIYVSGTFFINKGMTLSKTFPGQVSSIVIKSNNRNIKFHIESEDVIFQTDTIHKLTEYTLECDYKLKNPTLFIHAADGSTDVEIFIDGDTKLNSVDLQQYIDAFRL